MKFFILFNILILIGLSSQNDIFIKRDIVFPINAVSILRGEIKDPTTNELLQISGIAKFEQFDSTSNVTIKVDIVGLPLNSMTLRGLHIHTYGVSDSSDNITAVCGSTGAHFNPSNVTHGYLTSTIRHAGDLGNVMTNVDGTISVFLTNDRISLYDQESSIIGRSIVLHTAQDDGGLLNTDMSKATGTSGARIACGTIGLTKPAGDVTERVIFQMISPSLSDIEDKLKGSWVFDYIQSKVNTIKTNMNSQIGDLTDRIDVTRPSIFDMPSLSVFNSFMNDLARDKQVLDSMTDIKRRSEN